jgi:hypothetical protein
MNIIKSDNFVVTANFLSSSAMTEKFFGNKKQSVVVQRNYCLSFSSTRTQIFLHTSKLGPKQCRLRSLDEFPVKMPASTVTSVDCCAELYLAEDTELLVNGV